MAKAWHDSGKIVQPQLHSRKMLFYRFEGRMSEQADVKEQLLQLLEAKEHLLKYLKTAFGCIGRGRTIRAGAEEGSPCYLVLSYCC